jgi:hypothetical protein
MRFSFQTVAIRTACALILGSIVAATFALSGCKRKPAAERTAFDFKFPSTAKGWVIVVFDPENGLPIEKSAGRATVVIPPSKVIRIKHAMENGWAQDRFYFVDPSGNEVRIIDQSITVDRVGTTVAGKNREEVTYRAFFIGSEKPALDSYQHVREVLKNE